MVLSRASVSGYGATTDHAEILGAVAIERGLREVWCSASWSQRLRFHFAPICFPIDPSRLQDSFIASFESPTTVATQSEWSCTTTPVQSIARLVRAWIKGAWRGLYQIRLLVLSASTQSSPASLPVEAETPSSTGSDEHLVPTTVSTSVSQTSVDLRGLTSR